MFNVGDYVAWRKEELLFPGIVIGILKHPWQLSYTLLLPNLGNLDIPVNEVKLQSKLTETEKVELLEFVKKYSAQQFLEKEKITVEPKPHNTASIEKNAFCKKCGWPIIFTCCNGKMSVGKFKDWDWWMYCSNKGCTNHEGEGYFQTMPDWINKVKEIN